MCIRRLNRARTRVESSSDFIKMQFDPIRTPFDCKQIPDPIELLDSANPTRPIEPEWSARSRPTRFYLDICSWFYRFHITSYVITPDSTRISYDLLLTFHEIYNSMVENICYTNYGLLWATWADFQNLEKAHDGSRNQKNARSEPWVTERPGSLAHNARSVDSAHCYLWY